MTHFFKFFIVLTFSYQLVFADTVCSPLVSNKAALVVIDMQPYFVTRGGNHEIPANKMKTEKVLAAQIEAIQQAISLKAEIVFLEYEGYNVTDKRLTEVVKDYPQVKFLKKTEDGMLSTSNVYRKELVDHLQQKHIGTLVITGANGGACVLQSITGSLNASGNCNVIAYNQGIADFNYRDFIYPYVGYYKSLKPTCKDCAFSEVSDLIDVTNALAQ